MTSSAEDPQRLRKDYAVAIRARRLDEAAALAERIGITPPEFENHLRALQSWDGDQAPFDFDQFAAAAPGRFDPRVLTQSTTWVDVLRRPHRIGDREDLVDEHLLNVIGFLRRHAFRWAPLDWFFWLMAMAGEARGTWTPAHDEAVNWLETTRLMKALRTEARRRGLDHSSDS